MPIIISFKSVQNTFNLFPVSYLSLICFCDKHFKTEGMSFYKLFSKNEMSEYDEYFKSG